MLIECSHDGGRECLTLLFWFERVMCSSVRDRLGAPITCQGAWGFRLGGQSKAHGIIAAGDGGSPAEDLISRIGRLWRAPADVRTALIGYRTRAPSLPMIPACFSEL